MHTCVMGMCHMHADNWQERAERATRKRARAPGSAAAGPAAVHDDWQERAARKRAERKAAATAAQGPAAETAAATAPDTFEGNTCAP